MSADPSLELRRIAQQAIVHGGRLEAVARNWGCLPEQILDLSTGVYPGGPPAWLAQWFGQHAHLAARYPDDEGEPARTALSEALGVQPESVCVGAGAQAFIEVLVQAMGWCTLAIETPCYAEPLRAAQRAGCRIRSFAKSQGPAPADAVWITSPHNPDGALRDFPIGRRGVLDESYLPFVDRRRLGVMADVIRLGSLTKLFAIPGLRIGYVVARPDIIKKIRRWLPPWPVATPTLHLLPHLLQGAEERDASMAEVRRRLEKLLLRYGWQVLPSKASFVLARSPGRMPAFSEHRILVRMFPEWPELQGWVRFGLPAAQEGWNRLEAALHD